MKITKFKFIPKEIEEKNLKTKDCSQFQALLEIAYQLRRIADVMEAEKLSEGSRNPIYLEDKDKSKWKKNKYLK